MWELPELHVWFIVLLLSFDVTNDIVVVAFLLDLLDAQT